MLFKKHTHRTSFFLAPPRIHWEWMNRECGKVNRSWIQSNPLRNSTKTRDKTNTGFPVLELTILALQTWSFSQLPVCWLGLCPITGFDGRDCRTALLISRLLESIIIILLSPWNVLGTQLIRIILDPTSHTAKSLGLVNNPNYRSTEKKADFHWRQSFEGACSSAGWGCQVWICLLLSHSWHSQEPPFFVEHSSENV